MADTVDNSSAAASADGAPEQQQWNDIPVVRDGPVLASIFEC
jgi:hypothetical protein